MSSLRKRGSNEAAASLAIGGMGAQWPVDCGGRLWPSAFRGHDSRSTSPPRKRGPVKPMGPLRLAADSLNGETTTGATLARFRVIAALTARPVTPAKARIQ